MPPKKDAGKKPAAGAGDGGNELAVIAKAFELQNEALQRQLAERTERALAAERVSTELRARMRQMEADMLAHERSTFDITSEMKRQYAAMQEGLMAKVTALEGDMHRLRDDLAIARAQLSETSREKDAVIARRDEEIDRLRAKLEDMASEFGDMLAETLRKMGERVELSSASWEGEAPPGLMRKMEAAAAAAAASGTGTGAGTGDGVGAVGGAGAGLAAGDVDTSGSGAGKA